MAKNGKILQYLEEKCNLIQSVSQIWASLISLDGGSVLGFSQFSILPQLPLKTMFGLKEVKIDSKISNLLCESKSVIHCIFQFYNFL